MLLLRGIRKPAARTFIRCRNLASVVPPLELRVHNSLTGTKEALPPLPEGQSHWGWYACGPTVYDDAHIGHARTYVCFDMIRRVLMEHFGVPLCYAVGVTDIDDKILKKAEALKVPPHVVARKFEARFFADMATLGVLEPNAKLRVSEHMSDIIAYVEGIIARGYGYATPDGSVYFDVAAFGDQHYGRFGRTLAARAEGSGVVADQEQEAPDVSAVQGNNNSSSFRSDDNNSSISGAGFVAGGKRNAVDFALWKGAPEGARASEAAVSEGSAWPSPWGVGRPGWHIECSAMTHAHFGPDLQVHSGGKDLAFPHHCNEMAQCEAFQGAPGGGWVPLWLHAGHVHITGRKMSKSLKNFVTVRDFLSENGHPDDLRVFCLQYHYRSDVTYSEARMEEARHLRLNLIRFLERVQNATSTSGLEEGKDEKEEKHHSCGTSSWGSHEATLVSAHADANATVLRALADDFDTPKAMRALATLAAAGEAYLLAKESDFAASGALTNARTQFSVPPEPLALCARLVAKMSTLFGIESVASAYMPASAETSNADGTPGSSSTVSNTSGSAGEALHVLTDFRAEVRAAAKRALVANAKAAKAAKKAAAAKEDDGASPSRDEDGLKSSDTVAASALAQELLEMCDKLRDEVLPEKLGVALEDRPSGKAHVTTLRK